MVEKESKIAYVWYMVKLIFKITIFILSLGFIVLLCLVLLPNPDLEDDYYEYEFDWNYWKKENKL